MMENFPIMYKQTNFYYFIKKTLEHYKSLTTENMIKLPEAKFSKEKSVQSSNLKKIWKTGNFQENKSIIYN